jgi:hypothetical protein
MSFSVHLPDWKPWSGKAKMGLDGRMALRTDLQVESR